MAEMVSLAGYMKKAESSWVPPVATAAAEATYLSWRCAISVARGVSFRNLFVAGRGGDGMRKSRHGKNGKDVMLEVPVGSVVVNRATGRHLNF